MVRGSGSETLDSCVWPGAEALLRFRLQPKVHNHQSRHGHSRHHCSQGRHYRQGMESIIIMMKHTLQSSRPAWTWQTSRQENHSRQGHYGHHSHLVHHTFRTHMRHTHH